MLKLRHFLEKTLHTLQMQARSTIAEIMLSVFVFFLFRIFAAQWVSAPREAPLCSYHYLCSMFASTPYAITIVFLFASLSFFYDSFLLKSVNRCVSPDLAHTGAAMLPQSRCCSILVCKCVRSTFCRVLPKTSLPWSTR